MSSNSNNHPAPANNPASSSERRGSFLSSLFSMQQPTPTTPDVARHNSFSSSSTSSVSPSYSSLATHREDDGNLSGSPASSLASPLDSKFSPTDWNSSPHSRQSSLTGSLTGLTSSFRWPGSSPASNVQPISIPNSNPSSSESSKPTKPPPWSAPVLPLDVLVSAGPHLDVHSNYQPTPTRMTCRTHHRTRNPTPTDAADPAPYSARSVWPIVAMQAREPLVHPEENLAPWAKG